MSEKRIIMMDRRILNLLILSSCLCAAYGGPVYTNCETPPTILHGKTDLIVENDGDNVFAVYSCEPGYQLHGSTRIVCDLDTETWNSDLPTCKLETGDNATVSEMEPPAAIETFVTVSPEMTHQEVKEATQPIQDPNLGTFSNHLDEDNGDSNVNSLPETHPEQAENEVPETPISVTETAQKKRRRKPDIEEDNTIDDEFAERLDMSCTDDVAAPSIVNAYIIDYERRKHGERTFMIAIYACEQDYEFKNPAENRLYCSDKNWIGNPPVCAGDDYDSGDDYNYNENHAKSEPPTPETEVETGDRHEQSQIVEIENRLDVPSNGDVAVIETNENNNEVEIVNNELFPPSGNEQSVDEKKVQELPSNEPNCDVNKGGCDQICNMVQIENSNALTVECSCSLGFYLDIEEGKHCIDINECEQPEIAESCTDGCENTIGSYICRQKSVDVVLSANNDQNEPVKACGDGFRMDESNNCIDIDECAEGNTGCEYCQNSSGGYECVCPAGFELDSDGHHCRDIDECKSVMEDDYENEPVEKKICSHECTNTIGSFICKCPVNFHLDGDKRTCEKDFCRHLNDIDANKTKCSHDCQDDEDGYHCKCPEGMQLDIDLKNCIVLDACQSSGDRCLPGKCVNIQGGTFECECPDGYASYNQRCVDYDECAIEKHECSHKCKNIPGSYICECPSDLILASDHHTCVSNDPCQNNNGGCSNDCNLINGNVVCSCPDGFELEPNAKTCRPINICAKNNGGCQHVCNEALNQCECDAGFESFDDGKTCHDLNECLNNPCPQQCTNTEGGYECECFAGFEKDSTTGQCKDINECLSSDHQCEHGCENTEGSFMCVCRDGYQLAENRFNCVDINECNVNNGGCSHTCTNLPGGHKCTCPEGYRMDREKKACVQLEIKDNCPAFVPPINGDVSCSRSRHRSQNFHRTKCNVWCQQGFTLMGPSIRYCNGSTGLWDSNENSCVRSTCPALSTPSHGSFSSANCLSSNVYPGESCTLTCAQGFKSVGNPVTTCLPGRIWSTSTFNCVAVKSEQTLPKKFVNQGGVYMSGHINVDDNVPVTQQRFSPQLGIQNQNQNILRPYIKCPRDTIVLIKSNQRTAFIKLEQPKSNVDWASQIDVEPAGAKSLQMRLPVGVHTFKFRARSPNAPSISETCQTIITVKRMADVPATQSNLPISSHPEVISCPQNIQIQLQTNELRRAVSWKEPVFRSVVGLKQIFKSSAPGMKFGPGHHRVTYIATDLQNKNGTCQFSVIVHAPVAVNPVQASHQPYLNGHDSYLMCPNRPAMKLDTSFPVQIPNGCFIKNVRINHFNPHRRRHAFASNNNLLTHYSSWDQPLYRY